MVACSQAPDGLQRSSSLGARRGASSPPLHCCCGRIDCVFLRKNCSILETVEKDVHTAAQLGQALLARHEAYMADAERDRLHLTGRIDRLEHEKQDLECVNASTIEENRNLLDQLEALNNTVSDSDTRIKALEASLLSSQQCVRRLEAAAARAAQAEHHIAVLEDEHDRLYQELRSTRDDARTHAQRFKEAQRGILDMQDQLERMEEEARQENARHAEVVGRMERQREIDKQLDVAAGRLKGAAATKSLQEQNNGNKIIGHFVRDLLEDNANLQLGMAEFREMLMSSNDEIQMLREQLMHHQPIPHDKAAQSRTLEAELGSMQGGSKLSQELHIHHHYHLEGAAKKSEPRKPKKRRQGLQPFNVSPASATSLSPRPPAQLEPGSSPAAPTLVSPATCAATPASWRPRQSWGGLSNAFSDSSTSPGSTPSALGNSVFDTSYAESEAMTSPTTSFDPMSPTWRASHGKMACKTPSRGFQSLPSSLVDSGPPTPPGQPSAGHAFSDDTIEEEEEDQEAPVHGHDQTPSLVVDNAHSFGGPGADESDFLPEDGVGEWRLPRAASHESIMSLAGGLDIHTLKSRPRQMTLRRLGGVDAVVTGVTARPTLSAASSKRSGVALREHFAALQVPRMASTPNSRPASPGSSCASQGGSRSSGRWAGWRPWGAGPRAALGSLPGPGLFGEKEAESKRCPGINQPGAIPGFQQYWAAQRRKGAPAQVTASRVDHEALIEGLRE